MAESTEQERVDGAVDQLVQDRGRLGLTWMMRPGTATSEFSVILDGDTVAVNVVSLVGPIGPPLRVMVADVPDGGNYVLGVLGEPLAARLFKSAAFSYPNGASVIEWDGTSWDPWVMLANSVPSRLYPRGVGKFNVSVTLQFAANTTGTRSVLVRKNSNGSSGGGTAVVDVGVPAVALLATSVQCNVDVDVDPGDYLEVFAFQNSGGSLTGIEGTHRTFVQVKGIR